MKNEVNDMINRKRTEAFRCACGLVKIRSMSILFTMDCRCPKCDVAMKLISPYKTTRLNSSSTRRSGGM